ncbi:MAG: nucleoside-diphosphate-sugar epimerase [Pseudohongiellaceae bacterium]|jgi:nucleoside-diphosphate-sugar epimerase
MNNDNDAPIVIYGGNGFVGVAVCEYAAHHGFKCLSISRSGAVPAHLDVAKSPWLDNVSWLQGDALSPDIDMLKGARAIINLVGSPPLPTFTKSAFDNQLMMNGASQLAVVEAAESAGVNRLVIMGADIPSLLQAEGFAYYRGKKQAMMAAKSFAASSELRQAAVLQPGGIYGTRHTQGGLALPLSWFMSPLSALQQYLPQAVQNILPAAFVDVKNVAGVAVELATLTNKDFDLSVKGFMQVSNEKLLDWQSKPTEPNHPQN